MSERIDPDCICAGNWRAIVKEVEALFGRRFTDRNRKIFRLFGVVHGADDYYYGMASPVDGELRLISCVGSLTTAGYAVIQEPS